MTGVIFSGDELSLVANKGFETEKPVETKTAIVADKDWTFGMARIYQTYRDDLKDGATRHFQVFRNMEEAREWLGLPLE